MLDDLVRNTKIIWYRSKADGLKKRLAVANNVIYRLEAAPLDGSGRRRATTPKVVSR